MDCEEGMTVIDEVLAERRRQDEQWGGRHHDDDHIWADWWTFIQRQRRLMGVRGSARERFIKIAALAIAAVESHDRLMALSARLRGDIHAR